MSKLLEHNFLHKGVTELYIKFYVLKLLIVVRFARIAKKELYMQKLLYNVQLDKILDGN